MRGSIITLLVLGVGAFASCKKESKPALDLAPRSVSERGACARQIECKKPLRCVEHRCEDPYKSKKAAATLKTPASGQSPNPCIGKSDCLKEGRCSWVDGNCVVATDADCARSSACVDQGKCLAKGSACVAKDAPPQSAPQSEP